MPGYAGQPQTRRSRRSATGARGPVEDRGDGTSSLVGACTRLLAGGGGGDEVADPAGVQVSCVGGEEELVTGAALVVQPVQPRRAGPVVGEVGEGAGGVRIEEPDGGGRGPGGREVGGAVAGDVGGGTDQVDAGGETHEVADHVSGQASVDLDEAGPAVDEAHLYVADAVGDAEGVDRRPGGRRDGLPERVVGVHTVG